jgi:plasmid stability protein
MATVLIRDIPDRIMKGLKEMARKNQRSVQQEVRILLENSVNSSSPDVFQKAAHIRKKLQKRSIPFADSTPLLRQDRGP